MHRDSFSFVLSAVFYAYALICMLWQPTDAWLFLLLGISQAILLAWMWDGFGAPPKQDEKQDAQGGE